MTTNISVAPLQGADINNGDPRPGAPRKKRALPPATLYDAFGVSSRSLWVFTNFGSGYAPPLRNLSVLCVSVVNTADRFTAETQRAQKLSRAKPVAIS